MKEKPIIFSGPMVRAILDGRKTQTRRAIKPHPPAEFCCGDVAAITNGDRWAIGRSALSSEGSGAWPPDPEPGLLCPYGQPGTLLWVRETWTSSSSDPDKGYCSQDYRATAKYKPMSGKWTPSIHMPRWASRILLEVTGIRVERLQDISDEDARAEGLTRITKDGCRVYKYGIPDRDGLPGTDDHGWPWVDWKVSPRNAYWQLWDQINGLGSWDANPWVWVIEFGRKTMPKNRVPMQHMTLESEFTFGKHKGEQLEDVIEDDPNYIGWIVEDDVVSFDEEAMDKITCKGIL